MTRSCPRDRGGRTRARPMVREDILDRWPCGIIGPRVFVAAIGARIRSPIVGTEAARRLAPAFHDGPIPDRPGFFRLACRWTRRGPEAFPGGRSLSTGPPPIAPNRFAMVFLGAGFASVVRRCSVRLLVDIRDFRMSHPRYRNLGSREDPFNVLEFSISFGISGVVFGFIDGGRRRECLYVLGTGLVRCRQVFRMRRRLRIDIFRKLRDRFVGVSTRDGFAGRIRDVRISLKIVGRAGLIGSRSIGRRSGRIRSSLAVDR